MSTRRPPGAGEARVGAMLEKLSSWFSRAIAVDLGTANTLVYVRGRGVVLNEPSVVAVSGNGPEAKVVAVGREAKEMLGRTPGNIVAIRPIRDGVIADFTATQAMLTSFISRAEERRYRAGGVLLMSVPPAITSIERKAVREAALAAGAREVHLVEQPLAAAVGAGLPVQDARASMIVDIGGGTTDVAVLSLGGVVTSQTLGVAGDKLDEILIQFVRRRHSVLIGERTAERIKLEIGSADALGEELAIEVKGRDLVTGVPRPITLTSVEIRAAIQDWLRQIVGAVKATLERTPPELSADIVDRGIVLLGGGGQLRNLDAILSEACSVPVFVAENPLHAAALGSGAILEDLPRYQRAFW